MSEADRKVVQAAAHHWRDEQRKMITEGDKEYAAKLKEKGMEINEADKAQFAAAIAPVWATYETTYGPELMGLVKKYRDAK